MFWERSISRVMKSVLAGGIQGYRILRTRVEHPRGRDTHIGPFAEKRVTEACRIHADTNVAVVGRFLYLSNPKPSRPPLDGY